MMKIKLPDVLKAYEAITKVSESDVDFSTAHALVMMRKTLEPHIEFYAKTEKTIVEKYAMRDNVGQIIFNDRAFQILKGKEEDYMREKTSLDDVEVDIEIKTIRPIPTIKPSVLENLLCVFKFEG